MNKKFKILLITFLLVFPFYSIMAVAIPNPLGETTLTGFLKKIGDFMAGLAIGIAPIMIIYAGILFVAGGASPTAVTKAKQILIWTGVGLLIVFGFNALLGLINYIIGK